MPWKSFLKENMRIVKRTMKLWRSELRVKNRDLSDLALRTLSWITFSKRPLTTSELQHALAVTDGASTLDLRNLTTY